MKFFVPGIPAPKGSLRAFVPKGSRFATLTNANPATKPWETAIRVEAMQAFGRQPVLVGPVVVRVLFRMPRLKSHLDPAGRLLRSAPARFSKKPDVDKLLRTVLDALTAVVFVDDAQVDAVGARKRYCAPGEPPGAEIEVSDA